jgi:hypothetical protein
VYLVSVKNKKWPGVTRGTLKSWVNGLHLAVGATEK